MVLLSAAAHRLLFGATIGMPTLQLVQQSESEESAPQGIWPCEAGSRRSVYTGRKTLRKKKIYQWWPEVLVPEFSNTTPPAYGRTVIEFQGVQGSFMLQDYTAGCLLIRTLKRDTL